MLQGSDKLIASDGWLKLFSLLVLPGRNEAHHAHSSLYLQHALSTECRCCCCCNQVLQPRDTIQCTHNEWNEKERGRIRRRSIIMWESFNYDNLRPASTINHRRARLKNSTMCVPGALCFFSHIVVTCTLYRVVPTYKANISQTNSLIIKIVRLHF